MFSCEICEIFKNTFLYRTPPVAASVSKNNHATYLLKSIHSIQKQDKVPCNDVNLRYFNQGLKYQHLILFKYFGKAIKL